MMATDRKSIFASFSIAVAASLGLVSPTFAEELARLGTNTLVEWSQNLTQACGKASCRKNPDAHSMSHLLHEEIRQRLTREIAQDPEAISSDTWIRELTRRTTADRCRLLRAAYALSLTQRETETTPLWRLFTHQNVLATLDKLGHRPQSGIAPLCPDLFFPQSDVVEQAVHRGERLFENLSLTPQEAQARLEKIRTRYLSRGPVSRSPQG